MRTVVHKESGAIIFKKDKESLKVEKLEKKLLALEGRIKKLEKALEKLSSE